MNTALLSRAPAVGSTSLARRGNVELLTLVGIAALTVATFLLHLSQMHQSIFGDELWTLQQVSGRSFSGMMHAIRPPGENAPPLYFILAWASAKLGDPTIWIRLPSLILGTATIPAIYCLGRETVGRVAGVIGAGAFAVSPFATYYGIEARPYAATTCFVVLSTLALVKATRSGALRWWAAYAVAAAAAAYSGYTAVFVLVVQAVWSLWACRERLARPLMANAAVVLLYIPWLPHVGAKELDVIGALEPFNLHNALADVLRVLSGYPYARLAVIPTISGLLVLGACVLGGLGALAFTPAGSREHRHGPGDLRLIAVLALATPLGLALYSAVGTDIWDPRDLYVSLPAALLGVGALLAAMPLPARAVAVLAVVVILILGTVRALGPGYSRPPFRAAAQYLDDVAAPRDPVVIYPFFLGLDQDLQAEFGRPHLVVRGAPRTWPAAPGGGATFAVVENGLGPAAAPHPRGYVLAGVRRYRGLVRFSVLRYRPA